MYWDPHTDASGNSRQQSTKSRQSYHQPQQIPPHQMNPQQQQQQQHYAHRYHLHTAQIQPATGAYGCHQQYNIHNKPKSWDNLAMKGFGGYGFGYGYLDTVAPTKTKQQVPQTITTAKLQQPISTANIILTQQQQRHSIPRKNPYGRYSTFSDVENYAPPPSQFVQTITTTTITKSTENLLGTSLNHSDSSLHSCDGCKELSAAGATTVIHQTYTPMQMQQIQQKHHHDCRGYYSHLPRTSVATPTSGTNSNGRGVATVSEVTRL